MKNWFGHEVTRLPYVYIPLSLCTFSAAVGVNVFFFVQFRSHRIKVRQSTISVTMQETPIKLTHLILCSIIIITFATALLLRFIIAIGYAVNPDSLSMLIMTYIVQTLYFANGPPMLLLFVLRLNDSFKDTIYAPNKIICKCLIWATMIYVIVQALITILLFPNRHTNNHNGYVVRSSLMLLNGLH